MAQALANQLLPIANSIPETNDDKVTEIIIGVVVGVSLILTLLIGIVGFIFYRRFRYMHVSIKKRMRWV